MEDVMKNTELFLSILTMSRSSAVQKWDSEAFQRAFRWAQYFEQVYKKAKSKPAIAEKLRDHLQGLIAQPETKLGASALVFDDLGRATKLLQKNLIQNPYLNNDFYVALICQCQSEAVDENQFLQEVKSLSKLKATLQILQLIQQKFDRASARDSFSSSSSSGPRMPAYQVKANALLLRKCLASNIGPVVDIPSSMRRQLYKKLCGLLEHGQGERIVFMALRSTCGEHDEKVTEFLLQFIDDVICENWRINWVDFLELPLVDMLVETTCAVPAFFDMHLDVLKTCGDKIQEEREKNDCMLLVKQSECKVHEKACAANYERLRRHLEALCDASPVMGDAVRSFLQSCARSMKRTVPVEGNLWRSMLVDVRGNQDTAGSQSHSN